MTVGVRGGCSDSSRKCSAGTLNLAEAGKENTSSYAGIGLASVQGRSGERSGEGKAVGAVDGSRG